MRRLARSSAGFTLIELMLALGILALLVTLAVPAYRAPIERAERAQAAACLINLGVLLERHAAVTGSYEDFWPGKAELDCRSALTDRYRFEAGVPGTATWAAQTQAANRWQLRARRLTSAPGDVCTILVYQDVGRRGAMTGSGQAIEDPDRLNRCWR
ncbi:type IV pilin protein [Spiribacter salinus]|uniref:type IV pilin protein n=1 Tax=Spiribacter salinus TaxID=1335746 RepID=UPI001C95186E|nr:type IV pilin protein [Spiribacter salinus]MBY5269021.1 hypothetical protein [Spiribacter salinus]